jgi:hypothetical protein
VRALGGVLARGRNGDQGPLAVAAKIHFKMIGWDELSLSFSPLSLSYSFFFSLSLSPSLTLSVALKDTFPFFFASA